MKIDQFVKERPVASGVTVASIIAGVVVIMQFMPAMELIVRIKKAPDVADAALQKATESREWIDAYIAEQKHQRDMDQKLAEQQMEYQKQMLELQQQQIPNAPAPRTDPRAPSREEWHDPQTGIWWCSEDDWQTWWEC